MLSNGELVAMGMQSVASENKHGKPWCGHSRHCGGTGDHGHAQALHNVCCDCVNQPPMPPRPACAIGLHLWGEKLEQYSDLNQYRTCTRQGCGATERQEL